MKRVIHNYIKRCFSSGNVDVQSNIVNLCKHRGFVFPGSELYGGLANSYDYGPLGVQMKKNIQDIWWRDFIQSRSDCVGLDTSILLHPKVWDVSGHLSNFTDPMTVCNACNSRMRADKLVEDSVHVPIHDAGGVPIDELSSLIQKHEIPCPNCGEKKLSSPRKFNLLFRTFMGSTVETSDEVYLRPETAQGAYICYHSVKKTMRKSLPFGIGQIGKSFRNEISPGNFLFRTREFEQLELQYFCNPTESSEWFKHWENYCYDWLKEYGISEKNLRKRFHDSKELAHYASETTDIEYRFPFGWSELWGIANRGDYDLKNHMKGSGRDIMCGEQNSKERFLPHVIEPALGLGRVMLAMLVDAYRVEEVNGRNRVILSLHPDIAPYQFAVLPLSKNSVLTPLAESMYKQLSQTARVDYDITGSIGKRYRRQDEIGTPLCVTVDFESLEDGCVTLRARDSMKQVRLKIEDVLKNNYDSVALNRIE